MKRIALFVTVFVLLFSGCAGVKSADSGSPARAPSAIGQAAGILFKWDSAADPVTEPRVTQSEQIAAPNSGYADVFLRVRGADIPTADGALVLGSSPGTGGGGRLVIGGGDDSVSNADSENTSSQLGGQFNFSDGQFRLTVDYKDATLGTSNYMLRVSINNNTQAMANSPLGAFSNLRTYTDLEELAAGNATSSSNIGTTADEASSGQIVVTFNPSVRYAHPTAENVRNVDSLKNAYLVLHCQNGGNITITGIQLERL